MKPEWSGSKRMEACLEFCFTGKERDGVIAGRGTEIKRGLFVWFCFVLSWENY